MKLKLELRLNWILKVLYKTFGFKIVKQWSILNIESYRACRGVLAKSRLSRRSRNDDGFRRRSSRSLLLTFDSGIPNTQPDPESEKKNSQNLRLE